jgi:ABC-type phosphate/phosphonate transport system substrate-binding protein
LRWAAALLCRVIVELAGGRAFFESIAEAEQLRILAATPRTPAIPFVTAAATDPVMQAALAQALRCVAAEPKWAQVRAAMLLLEVVPPDQVDYGTPCRYATEAAALGYPRLY